ncbi:hypothetical protein Amal_00760 [Acetobacter malorum]|uniref:Uncharacterized protein n=1 Tax=Acetobacter malorum TaxID=178901 RepID=A0A177GF18_9PROT|nr:hypothetical protein Amal_00760 [Acetobacter malorum]
MRVRVINTGRRRALCGNHPAPHMLHPLKRRIDGVFMAASCQAQHACCDQQPGPKRAAGLKSHVNTVPERPVLFWARLLHDVMVAPLAG